MIDPEMTVAKVAEELPEARRARQAAEDVATWQAAFMASKGQAEIGPPGRTKVGT